MIIPKKWWCAVVLALLFHGCKQGGPPEGGPPSKEVQELEPKAVSKRNATGLWAHYMPWFEDKKSSGTGEWGMHWTMATKNPDRLDATGKREIAAHYYPLIGPYASSDPVVLEYHFLLMKYAGIDGIWIDWYGTRNLHDYEANRRNTEVIVDVLKRVGLKYAIVYEDQTLRDEMTTDGQRVAQAIGDMRYLQSKFFTDPAYFTMDGRPLLLTFGPQVLQSPAMWSTVLGSMPVKPMFFTLYNHSERAHNDTNPNTAGEFVWVDATSMDIKYAYKPKGGQMLGGAYPGFRDFYQAGGWGNEALAPIDHEGGNLLKRLLDRAESENMKHVQLITWNDFGEGTMIEPTEEFGFKFLETVQNFAGVAYGKKELEDILRYYTLKKQFADDPAKQKQLLQAFYYYIALERDKAAQIISKLEK